MFAKLPKVRKLTLLDMAEVGILVTKKFLLKGVSVLADKMNLGQKVISTRWTRNFFKRHSTLSIRKAQTLPKHKTFVFKQDIETWFQKILRIKMIYRLRLRILIEFGTLVSHLSTCVHLLKMQLYKTSDCIT